MGDRPGQVGWGLPRGATGIGEEQNLTLEEPGALKQCFWQAPVPGCGVKKPTGIKGDREIPQVITLH